MGRKGHYRRDEHGSRNLDQVSIRVPRNYVDRVVLI